MLKQKRTWNLIGCILGLVMLIVGLVFQTLANGGEYCDYYITGNHEVLPH